MEEILENTPETFQRLINEANEYKDKYLRVEAESQNYKRRVEREKETAVKFANERFARDLIDTLDNFENALKVELPESASMGIQLIYKNLVETMQKYGVVECQIDKFDPTVHEAVSAVSAGMPPNCIVEVLRKGYLMEDRLLRPASVILSK